MKERPILFTTPMVQAILAGRKTQTRRIVNWKNLHKQAGLPFPTNCRLSWFKILQGWGLDAGDSLMRAVTCPYGQPGDHLWVKETWNYAGSHWWSGAPLDRAHHVNYIADGLKKTFIFHCEKVLSGIPKQRDMKKSESDSEYSDYLTSYWNQKRPSIFMPKWASRITLEMVAVRVQRLRDISTKDAEAEGIFYNSCGVWHWRDDSAIGGSTPVDAYRALWESINGADSWDLNPWVWVVEFRRAL